MACRLNQASRSFDKAADNLARTAQVHRSGELLRQVVESEGRAIQAAAKAGRLPVAWDAGDCPALDNDGQETGKTRIYLGSDGVMVPMVTDAEKQARRKKVKVKRRKRGKKCKSLPKAKKGADLSFKEFKIVTLYDDTCAHRLVSVTRGDCAKAGALMRRDAGRVGLDEADDKVAVVDGAEWIRNQLQQQSLPLDAIGLDFYHFAENVHKARRAVYGEEDPKDKEAPGNAWAAELLHKAKQASYVKPEEAVWDWALSWRGAKRKAALGLLNYMSERDDMIRYPEFQAAGRQIGSGPTESMGKATRQRVKGRAMRWDADNAEALMAIEALEQSGGWQAYWDSLLALAL
jgi:hypothetical protein